MYNQAIEIAIDRFLDTGDWSWIKLVNAIQNNNEGAISDALNRIFA